MSRPHFYSPRPRGTLEGRLLLSEPESFRLFIEGVNALAAFERTGLASSLREADLCLSECVRRYPNDLLPRLYLGIAKSLGGLEEVSESESHLRRVIEAGGDTLLWPATYNLAAALVQTYDPAKRPEATSLLESILNRFLPRAARWARRAHRNDSLVKSIVVLVLRVQRPIIRRSDSIELALQAWALQQYIMVHVLVYDRTDGVKGKVLGEQDPTKRKEEVTRQQARIDEAARQLSLFDAVAHALRVSKMPGGESIIADYHNNRGHCEWASAILAKVSGSSDSHALSALAEFDTALSVKPGWEPALANKALVSSELLGDPKTARDIWESLILGQGETHYAHYRLGQLLATVFGDVEAAREHLTKAAPFIPEARKELDSLPPSDG